MNRPLSTSLRSACVLVLLCGAACGPVAARGEGARPGAPAPAGPGAQAGAAPVVNVDGRSVTTDMHARITQARDRVFPALVNITVISVSYWGGSESKGGSTGSGTIITPDGLVVTNHHVIDDGKSFKVTLADKREVSATLVGDDPMTDLALLRINMKELGDNAQLPVATFGDSDTLAVGDYVMAMGAPYGLARSFTLGVVSNTERVFTSFSGDDIQDQEFDFDVSSDIFTRWIQHDALILPGNSGGPLVNLDGQIIGVNTRGGSGLGFANPSSLVKRVVDELSRSGEVTRSTIGANFKSVKRTGYKEGVLVNSVIDGSAADKAGLRAGDVVTAMNGQAISARFPEEIPLVLRRIADMPVGSSIQLSYMRDGQAGSATVVTEKLLKERGKETSLRMFGMSISEITPKMARNRNLDTTEGVLCIGVRGGGPSEIAEPALRFGDIIKAVDGKPVRTVQEAIDTYKALVAKEPIQEYVTIEFDRNGKNNLTLIKPRPEKPDDPPRELPKAWIGIATQPVLRQLSKQLELPEEQTGFRVTRVYPRTLAAESGLKQGDIIVALNDKALSPRGMQDAGMFQRQVRQLAIQGKAKLRVLRDRQATDIEVTLERTRLTQEEALRDTNRDFELTVRELTFFDLDDNRWSEDTQGVVVVNADHAGWAGLAGIAEGDLIQKINNTPITDLASYRKAMEEIAKQQPERVAFFVLRGTRTQFKFAEPQWKPTTAATPEAGKDGDKK
ncbi:MAG: PDZ domain-containing protein [Phycisphaerales bacterium]